VFATLLDSEDYRTDKYEVEWNGYWQFFNVMQFLGSFAAVTANGLAQNIYDAIPLWLTATMPRQYPDKL
jgi:DEAD/DEAH box helicase domain-containing protein